jgi:hypothetical protein
MTLLNLFILFYPPESGWRQRCEIRWKVCNWHNEQERMVLALVSEAGNVPLHERHIKNKVIKIRMIQFRGGL